MKKLLAFVLAAIMTFSVLPVTALAEERVFNEKSGLVYISISDDDKYVVSDGNISGKIMAYVPVDLSKLSSVDLDKYGYGDLYYKNNDGKYEITLYTSCCNTDKGIYYYNTYENHQISAVNMHNVDLDGDKIYRYPIIQGEKIFMQN